MPNLYFKFSGGPTMTLPRLCPPCATAPASPICCHLPLLGMASLCSEWEGTGAGGRGRSAEASSARVCQRG